MVVISSGLYEQTVQNECEEVKDEISVTFAGTEDVIIPNIITDDGNSKNDQFIISGASEHAVSLTIFNRWGKAIFTTEHYRNNWPDTELVAGVYFIY